MSGPGEPSADGKAPSEGDRGDRTETAKPGSTTRTADGEAKGLAHEREQLKLYLPIFDFGARPESRFAWFARAAVITIALFFFWQRLQAATSPLLSAKQGQPIPTEEIDDYRFRLPERTRREMFAELATAELAERARAIEKNTWNGHVWSREDDRGHYERVAARGVAQKYRVSLTQVYLVLDEGIRLKWPGPDGNALPGTTPPLDIRSNRGDRMISKVTFRWPDRLVSLMALRLVLWITVAMFTHEGILTDAFKVADWMDDHQFYSWEESDRSTLLRWHQLPAWNPFWCGGTVGIAAPEDPFFGPDFILRLIFGVAHGRRLAIILLVVLGFEGMYRLCRRLDSSAMGAVFAAVVYGTCDRFVSFIHDGWVNFMGFELIPFVLYFLVEGTYGPADPTLAPDERRRRMFRARLLGGFFVAWIILSAGTYPTPYAMLSVGYLTIALSIHGFFRGSSSEPPIDTASPWRRLLHSPWLVPWVAAVTIGVVALCISAAKILPTLSFLRQFPRVFTPVETHQAGEMFNGFWTRYGIVLALGLLGVVTADLAAGIFCGGAILFFALAMGDYGGASPFHLLKALPIFGQLRFPDRFMVGVLLFSSVAASRGVTRLEDVLPAAVKRGWELFQGWRHRAFGRPEMAYPREVGWALVGLAAFLAYKQVVRPYGEEILTSVKIKRGGMYVQEGPRTFDGPFRQSRGNRRDVHMFTPANLGSIYCVAGNPVPESALLRGDLAQEEYPQDPTKASVKRLEWSPNRIDLEVDAKEPTTILVNQNWARQWQASIGTVKSEQKLLAVDVPAGKNVVVLEYKDRYLDFCVFLSFVSLLGAAYVLGRDGLRWAKREQARWATLPLWPGDPPPTPAPAAETKESATAKKDEPDVETAKSADKDEDEDDPEKEDAKNDDVEKDEKDEAKDDA